MSYGCALFGSYRLARYVSPWDSWFRPDDLSGRHR